MGGVSQNRQHQGKANRQNNSCHVAKTKLCRNDSEWERRIGLPVFKYFVFFVKPIRRLSVVVAPSLNGYYPNQLHHLPCAKGLFL
jgi:hypothetical protein